MIARHKTSCLGALALVVCLLAAAVLLPAAAGAFALKPGSFKVIPSTQQAGAHADLTTTFKLVHNGAGETQGNIKTTTVELPPGFIGSNTAVPTCSASLLLGSGSSEGSECPPDTQVGTIAFTLDLHGSPVAVVVPLYSIEVTSPGIAAVLGFNFGGVIVQNFLVNLRPGDSGLTVTSEDLQGFGEVSEASVTVWGVPAAASHDPERGRSCSNGSCSGGGQSVDIPIRPFLANPTSCAAGPLAATLTTNDWQDPEVLLQETTQVAPMIECDRVPFDPTIETSPTTDAAESASGLDVSLINPQSWENPISVSTANLRGAAVTLPEGMSLNPSAGSGLGSCSETQLAGERYDSLPGEGCPPESKVGSVEVETPVLTEHATGSVYVAKPFANPFNSLLALYIVAKIPSRGIIVKVAGEVHADPLTGQLTTTFNENPQVPFGKFTLRFNQGRTSPLISPPACGSYTTQADLTPWSAPDGRQRLSSEFQIEHGVGGGPCPGGGLPPFHPLLHAGSYSNQAGAYSPFYIRLAREDGEQEITRFSIKLPPGLVGKLAGIPFCSDAQIAAAKGRTGPDGGQEELEHPSCPAASEIGRTEVEAGVGTVLASAPGKVYLAGPYHGSPLSIAAITAAKVGPFDLGTVVVREALKINPETAEVSVDPTGSDPLPHIIDGIPTHLRNIRIYMDRPEFVLNPTNCKTTSTASTVLGSGKDFVSEADDQPRTVSSFFQVANCAALGFKPKLALTLLGKTRRGGLPKLEATVTYPKGGPYANIAGAVVSLPYSELLEQGHIGTSCTRVQFNAGGGNGEQCPAKSIYGHARAITPLLEEPLEGPVYLRSNGGERQLPDLVAALHSKDININLLGFIDSVHKKGSEKSSIRTRFLSVPDAPVSKFTLEMFGGKKGLLINSTNLCKGTHKAKAQFTGQNGKLYETEPKVQAQCGKKGGKGKGAKKKSAGKKKGH